MFSLSQQQIVTHDTRCTKIHCIICIFCWVIMTHSISNTLVCVQMCLWSLRAATGGDECFHRQLFTEHKACLNIGTHNAQIDQPYTTTKHSHSAY